MRLTEEQFVHMFGAKALKEPVKKPKYRNKKCEWRGQMFDSIRERDRFIILEHEQSEGRITDLNRQVSFQLLPPQRGDGGKILEKACFYVADFTYRDSNGRFVVEDVKGVRTQAYILKRKMMLWFHGIRVTEV